MYRMLDCVKGKYVGDAGRTDRPGSRFYRSGGIRTIADLDRMVAAGASPIGNSSGAKIVAEFPSAFPRQ
jgi:deoxyribose-phosphate aldolase